MNTRTIHSIVELRATLAARRSAGASVGLVPTMGALHAGHRCLIAQSVRETACTVISIFVNPIQFNDAGDFQKYPRTLQDDVKLCGEAGAEIVFAPTEGDMYSQVQRTFVDVEGLSERLCGAFRPGHFRGVATVVLKLFSIVEPDVAYFGEKDAQQLAVIRRMASDLNLAVKIVGVPTVREPDGLAISSRNRHLSVAERLKAPALYRALQRVQARVAGGASDLRELHSEAVSEMERAGLSVQYLELVDPDSIEPVERITSPTLVACAVWLGSTRLIDNVICKPIALK